MKFNELYQKKNDLLFVEGNGSKSQIGRGAICDGSMLPNYALYYFMSYYGRNQIHKDESSPSGLYTHSANK